jgi:hypothetical protein
MINNRLLRQWLLTASLSVAVSTGFVSAACNRAVSQPVSAEPVVDPPTPAKNPPSQVRPLTFQYAPGSKPGVGTRVEAAAEGLRPGQRVELVWETVTGGWVVENYYRFLGKKFNESTRSLGHAEVGPDGRLAAQFAIPEDYGGVHNVLVTDEAGTLAQGGIEVQPTFEIFPK